MSNWQDRIIGFNRIPASDFLANPQNPRRHPGRQRDALRGSLDTLGWVAPVLVNKRTGFMLDGHARIEEALSKDENALIPVIEVDLEEHEEKLFLASFDYITYMAEYDRDSLDSLLQDVQTDDTRLQAMLSELAETQGIIPSAFNAPESFAEYGDDIETEYCCPKCGYEWSGKPK